VANDRLANVSKLVFRAEQIAGATLKLNYLTLRLCLLNCHFFDTDNRKLFTKWRLRCLVFGPVTNTLRLRPLCRFLKHYAHAQSLSFLLNFGILLHINLPHFLLLQLFKFLNHSGFNILLSLLASVWVNRICHWFAITLWKQWLSELSISRLMLGSCLINLIQFRYSCTFKLSYTLWLIHIVCRVHWWIYFLGRETWRPLIFVSTVIFLISFATST